MNKIKWKINAHYGSSLFNPNAGRDSLPTGKNPKLNSHLIGNEILDRWRWMQIDEIKITLSNYQNSNHYLFKFYFSY